MPVNRPDFTILINEIYEPILIAARFTIVTNSSDSLHCL
jgi:hypothetical protein